MKKILTLFLVLALSLTFVGCGKNKEKQLATPENVKLENGIITWDNVENAKEYVVLINETEYTIKTSFYQVQDLSEDFSYCITAIADGYKASKPTELFKYDAPKINVPEPSKEDIKIGIKGSSEVKSGKSITLEANVSGTENKEVSWEVVQGKESVSINELGVLTAQEVTTDTIIEVTATSKADNKVKASKIITIVSRPILEQYMLDAIGNDTYLSFEGYININLYSIASFSKLEQTYSTVVSSAMCINDAGEEYWYAEYENADTYTTQGMYFKNHNGLACQVGLSFMNEEQYEPMLDDNGNPISWERYGLYNNFKGLKVSDFTFNDETWRYEYTGSDPKLDEKMIASANPYEFIANGFSLIMEEGEILGIYAKSADDYTIMQQYRAVQELVVALNYGKETVEVPTFPTYTFDEEVHGPLREAITNMQNLDSYTLDYRETIASYMATGYIEKGFSEIITDSVCYFVPYEVSYNIYGEEVRTPDPLGSYGYKKINDNLYNSYSNFESGFEATRAYEKDFSNAKPSFKFAAELFTSYYIDNEENTTTYYVDDIMSGVASTFYYGVGNDINLYGIFATAEAITSFEKFVPYVVIDNETKYIIESGFYFYLGSMYGVIELNYSDFNNSKLPSEVDVTFEPRQVPTSWNELIIYQSEGMGSTEDDTPVNALTFLMEYFGIPQEGKEEFELNMPFFGDPLGDTYGFGLESNHIDSNNKNHKAVTFYYDVPLDIDYTIDSSLKAIEEYLIEKGFSKNKAGEFQKDNIMVHPVDNSLDLYIYVWKSN